MIRAAESNGASGEELQEILGRGRAKKGIFEGDLEEGELEIGQAAAFIDKILPVNQIMSDLIKEYKLALNELQNQSVYQFDNE